jgi:Ca2+-binding EF-hand superfamily protein
LDKSELASAFERSGVGVSNARLDRFFSYIDKDHDGSIDYNEWRGKLGLHLPLELTILQTKVLTLL